MSKFRNGGINLKQRKKLGTNGYTLVELMVVITIMAILAASATGVYTGYIEKARSASLLSTGRQIKEALLICETEYKASAEYNGNSPYWNDAFLKAPNHPDSVLYPYVGDITGDCTGYTLKIGNEKSGKEYIKGFIYETDEYTIKWVRDGDITVTKK